MSHIPRLLKAKVFLLIGLALFLGGVEVLAQGPCLQDLASLQMQISAPLVSVLGDLATLVQQYSELESHDPQSEVLRRLIIQKSETIEALLLNSHFSAQELEKVKELFSVLKNKLKTENDIRTDKISSEEKKARADESMISSFEEEKSPFTEFLNTVFGAVSWASGDGFEMHTSHDGKYYVLFHPRRATIIDTKTGFVRNMVDPKSSGDPRFLGRFYISLNRQEIIYAETEIVSEWDVTNPMTIYSASIDELAENPANNLKAITSEEFKKGQIQRRDYLNFPETILSADQLLTWEDIGKHGLGLFSFKDWPNALVKYDRSERADAKGMGASQITPSPDGLTLAVAHTVTTPSSKSFIGIYDLKTGAHKFDLPNNGILREYSPWSLSFSPDGKKIAVTYTYGIAIWSLDNIVEPEKIIEFPKPLHLGIVTEVTWSSDGDYIAFTNSKSPKQYLRVFPVKATAFGSYNVTIENGGNIRGVQFSPTGDRVLLFQDTPNHFRSFKRRGAP